ncbi:MAG: Uncharacterized protein Athens071426_353 [Parcubacteria group bacterium Athens0714_26]|nr:MAG: Uncharacterized protein Athens101426_138 [Parcubacteria group bacterium Athens1014_26]TSD02933.1 MAG: Uncharacterized protein Athens071426_353 [Parcubacteria group bacterium Athens0714_26]
MDAEKDFKTIITETLDLKNINHEKLSQLTGIPKHYILAIENSDISKLPALPYVRGYIKKISEVLLLNQDELWQSYEKALEHKRSGAFDKLPSNRFLIKRINKKTAIFITLAILALIFLSINYKNLFGSANIEITNPGNNLIAVSNAQYILTGKINPKDKLTINNVEVLTDFSGNFQFPYDLQPGLNTIEFRAKKILGKETIEKRQILYQPPAL